MSDIDQLTEEKQNYLRENILEKGYDGNTFVAFLIEKRGEEGAEIANWSLPDLKAQVAEFISLNEQNKSIENNQDNQNQLNENINNNENVNNINLEENNNTEQINKKEEENKNDWVEYENVKNDKTDDVPVDNYGIKNYRITRCKTIPNNKISYSENVQIKVDSFEKVEEKKIFSKGYITYTIVTLPINWKVKRRFNDFEWFHQILVNNYNYCLIPSTPKKKKNLNKIVTDKFDEAFLRRRSRKFEKFLNHLINHPILKNLNVVYDFLSIEKDDDFQKKKKIYEKKNALTNVNEFITIDGSANIEINGEKEYYMKKIKENTLNNKETLKRINSSINSLRGYLNKASKRMDDISNNFKLMKMLAKENTEQENVLLCYEELSAMFDNLSLYIKKQNYIISIYFREYFKYVKNNYRSLQELIHIGESIKNNFNKSLKNLKSKKEELVKKPETINKWELDPKENINKDELINNKKLALEKILYKETNNVNNQKQLYGFYLNKIIIEYEGMRKNNAEKHFKETCIIFEKETDLTTDYLTCLADNNMALMKKEGHNIKNKERKMKREIDEEVLDLEIQKEESKDDKN